MTHAVEEALAIREATRTSDPGSSKPWAGTPRQPSPRASDAHSVVATQGQKRRATGLPEAKPRWLASLSPPRVRKQDMTGRQLRFARPGSSQRARAADTDSAARARSCLRGGPASAVRSREAIDDDGDEWQPPGAWHYDHVCGTWHRGLRVAFDRPSRRPVLGTSTYAPSRPQLAQLGDSLQGAMDSLRQTASPDLHSSPPLFAMPPPQKGPKDSHRPAPRPHSARSHRNARSHPCPIRPRSASHRLS